MRMAFSIPSGMAFCHQCMRLHKTDRGYEAHWHETSCHVRGPGCSTSWGSPGHRMPAGVWWSAALATPESSGCRQHCLVCLPGNAPALCWLNLF